jgi:hypothetical protein
MSLRVLFCFVSCALFAQSPGPVTKLDREEQDTAELRDRIEASTMLPYKGVHFAVRPPAGEWESGAVSGVSVDSKGTIYEIQRGDKAASRSRPRRKLPSIVGQRGLNDSAQHPHRSYGRGVDCGCWLLNRYQIFALGKKIMTITVGEQPDNGSPFNGTTDVAFGPNGRIFVTDGYGNARVLKYTAEGKRVKQWGKSGTTPGDFNLPHSIQIDSQGIIYYGVGGVRAFDIPKSGLACRSGPVDPISNRRSCRSVRRAKPA